MKTISKFGIVKHKIHRTILLAHMEPKSTKQALADPTWLVAMKVEYDALIKNDTWLLVPLPPNRVRNGNTPRIFVLRWKDSLNHCTTIFLHNNSVTMNVLALFS